MLLLNRTWVVAIAVSVALVGTACQPTPAENAAGKRKTSAAGTGQETGEPSASEPASKSGNKASQKAKQPEPPPPPTIPKVAMSETLRAACLVNVGDVLPDAELPDVAGKYAHSKESVWTEADRGLPLDGRRYAPVPAHGDSNFEGLDEDSRRSVRAERGAVVGINVGNAVEDVRQHIAQAGAAFPNLLDPKGGYFAKLAKDRQMPRIYLLDAGGKILWFDVEVFRLLRQNLVQGIRVARGTVMPARCYTGCDG